MVSKIFYRAAKKAIFLKVKATSGARRDALNNVIELPDGERLAISVRAAPDKGKANTAICKLLADKLGLAKTRLSVVSGPTSRLKTISIAVENSDERTSLLDKLAKINAGQNGEI